MPINLSIIKIPVDSLGETNCVYISYEIPNDLQFLKINNFIFTVKRNQHTNIDQIAMNMNTRTITNLKVDDQIDIEKCIIVPPKSIIIKLVLKVSHWLKNKISNIDYKGFVEYLLLTLKDQYLTKGQTIYSKFGEKYSLYVENFTNINDLGYQDDIFAQITENTEIILKCCDEIKLENIPENLLDSEFAHNKNLININPYDLEKLGIGGLSTEFITLFRRAFISRLLPPSYLQKLDIKHVTALNFKNGHLYFIMDYVHNK
jgi:vesicle-fusing ATPase